MENIERKRKKRRNTKDREEKTASFQPSFSWDFSSYINHQVTDSRAFFKALFTYSPSQPSASKWLLQTWNKSPNLTSQPHNRQVFLDTIPFTVKLICSLNLVIALKWNENTFKACLVEGNWAPEWAWKWVIPIPAICWRIGVNPKSNPGSPSRIQSSFWFWFQFWFQIWTKHVEYMAILIHSDSDSNSSRELNAPLINY